MEPVTGAVVAIVLWSVLLVACWALPSILGFFGGLIGDAIAADRFDSTADLWGLGVGAVLGWISAVALTILSLIQGILQIIHLVELLA